MRRVFGKHYSLWWAPFFLLSVFMLFSSFMNLPPYPTDDVVHEKCRIQSGQPDIPRDRCFRYWIIEPKYTVRYFLEEKRRQALGDIYGFLALTLLCSPAAYFVWRKGREIVNNSDWGKQRLIELENNRIKANELASAKAKEKEAQEKVNAQLTDKIRKGHFQYCFQYNSTGYGINITEGTFYATENYLDFEKKLSDIRSIERSWITPGKHSSPVIFGSGSGLAGAGSLLAGQVAVAGATARKNRQEKASAYEQSGLFIYMADVDRPMIHLRFGTKESLLKAYEIFSQAMEGRLMPEKDKI